MHLNLRLVFSAVSKIGFFATKSKFLTIIMGDIADEAISVFIPVKTLMSLRIPNTLGIPYCCINKYNIDMNFIPNEPLMIQVIYIDNSISECNRSLYAVVT